MFFARTTTARLLALTTVLAPVILSGCDAGPKPPGTVAVTFTTKQGDENLFVWGVSLDGANPRTVNSNSNGTFTLEAVPPGDHHLILSSLPKACSSGADDRIVTVPSKDTVRVTIAVKCTRVTGDVSLFVSTSGVEFDLDGYTVSLDGASGPHLDATNSATVLLARLTPGAHEITLSGLASNCSVAPTEPHTALVVVDQAVTLSVNVVCRSTNGTIQVITATNNVSTADPDGYLVTVGTASSAFAPPNGVTNVSAKAGSYTVTLSDIEPSCTASPASKTITIAALETIAVNFAVTCGAYPATVAGATSADPADDTLPNATNNPNASFDIVAMSTRYGSTFMVISLKFSRPIGTGVVTGAIDLDVDENAATGDTALLSRFGGPLIRGVDRRIAFGSGIAAGTFLLSTIADPKLIGAVADGDSMQFFLPYSKLQDDGNLSITTIIGPIDRPTDFAPNTGVVVSHIPPGAVVQNRFTPYGPPRRVTAGASTLLESKRFTWNKLQR